jgi:hypothetical protein
MTMKRLALLTFVSSLVVVAFPSSGIARTPIDPNLHDTLLGTTGGIRYATEGVEAPSRST